MPTLGEVVAALDRLYDPAAAAEWDAVGLVCGDPDAAVSRVLLAVDPVAATVAESIDRRADLLLTHHPLLLRPVHGVPASTAKGRLVHRLIAAGVGLHVAHTNADVARPGVSDALAAALGLADVRPLRERPAEGLDKVVTFVPREQAGAVVDALAAAGAGEIGDYRRCAWLAAGSGTFVPGPGAAPLIGRLGEVADVAETRVEMVSPRRRRTDVLRALRAAHPYQTPAVDVFELAGLPGGDGFGRVGELADPMSLADFLAWAARCLPATPAGLRAGGDPDRVVRTVAVTGGAGDEFLDDAARVGADVYLTADLRHHRASERLEAGGPALVDAPHWATEQPWLHDAAARLRSALHDTVETVVSELITDPWTLHRPARLPPAKEPSTAP